MRKLGKQQAIKELKTLQAQVNDLRGLTNQAPRFAKWHRDVDVAIDHIFGPDSRQSNDFAEVRFSSSIRSHLTPDNVDELDCDEGLSHAHAILASMIDEIET